MYVLDVAYGGLEMEKELCQIKYIAQEIANTAGAAFWDNSGRVYHIERLRIEFQTLVKLMEEMK